MFRVLVMYMALFFYIYPISFVFLPISTRVLLGFFGLGLLAYKLIKRNFHATLHKEIVVILLLLILILFSSVFSLLINNTQDYQFVKYPFSMIFILLAAYFVVSLITSRYRIIDFQGLALLIINVVLIQSFFAVFLFIFPSLMSFTLSIQAVSPDELARISYLSNVRMYGFGSEYFGAGIVHGFALILISLALSFSDQRNILSLALKFIFIFVIGMMMARTTLIGAALSLIIIFSSFISHKLAYNKLFFSYYIIFLPLLLLSFILFFVPSLSEKFWPIIEQAFELFFNYFNKGSASTASTDELLKMYVFPESLKTWFIGDGLWSNPLSNGYYMSTDVGYLRLIYYFGLVGTLMYLVFQLFVICISFKNINYSYLSIFAFITYLMILNLKGFTDLFFLVVPFLFVYLFHKNKTKLNTYREPVRI